MNPAFSLDFQEVPVALDEEQRHREAADLRRAGATYEEIAEALDYASASGAFYAAKQGIEAAIREGDEHTRQLELDRLDAMLLGLWPKARKGDVYSVDRVLKVMERRARFLGLDVSAGAGEKGEEVSPVDDIAARRRARLARAKG